MVLKVVAMPYYECRECGAKLKDELEIRIHVMETGHRKFKTVYE